MSRHTQNVSFECERCAHKIEKLSNGSFRNHCPACLWSKHVDILPGDRANPCKGLMEPIGLHWHPKKGWQIIHKCSICGHIGRNIAASNSIQPDNADILIALSQSVWTD
ncbi:RNHCP domain-containing protein [Maritalea porphyrae]|uniref:RNHCP domain-containing protein n=1 Tax=Maritalea porphyrae TaxID=880732 RepID=UPI003AFB1F54